MLISTTVSDIADPDARSIAIGPFGSSLKAEMYEPSGVAVIRGQNIVSAPQIDEGDLVFVSPETASKFPACLVSEGDLVFPHRGAIGRVGIVGSRPMLLSSSMMKLRCDRTKVDPLFMLYYFRGPGKDQLLMRASTVGTPGIGQPLTSLRGIPLSIPPLVQQQAIAEVLGALDDKIAANTKLAKTTDQFLGALFAHITDGASTLRLGDVAIVNPENRKSVPGGILRYIDISSVAQGTFDFPEISRWDEAPSRARRGLKSGDTMWSTVRPNRRSHALNLSNDPLLVGSTGLAILRPREVGFAYLFEATKTPAFAAYLENVAEGSAYPAVRANRFDEAPILWAPPAERDSFETVAAPLRRALHSLDSENIHLVSVRDALLPQLMSGNLKVKQAEEIVSAAI